MPRHVALCPTTSRSPSRLCPTIKQRHSCDTDLQTIRCYRPHSKFSAVRRYKFWRSAVGLGLLLAVVGMQFIISHIFARDLYVSRARVAVLKAGVSKDEVRSGLPWELNFNSHTHPIPTEKNPWEFPQNSHTHRTPKSSILIPHTLRLIVRCLFFCCLSCVPSVYDMYVCSI